MPHALVPHVVTPHRREWWYDRNNQTWTTTKRWNELRDYDFNLKNWLDTGETISTMTIKNVNGPTVASTDITSDPIVTIRISGAGYVVLVVTKSTGDIIEIPLRWIDTDRTLRDRYSWYDGY